MVHGRMKGQELKIKQLEKDNTLQIMNTMALRCCFHGTSLLGGMCLLVDDVLGQLHQLLSKIHVIRLWATFLGDLGRRDCG